MLERFRRKTTPPPPPAPADYSAGRDWDPLDMTDGKPRMLLTLVQGADGTLAFAVDHWNLNDQKIAEFYASAGGSVAAYALARKGSPDACSRPMETTPEAPAPAVHDAPTARSSARAVIAVRPQGALGPR